MQRELPGDKGGFVGEGGFSCASRGSHKPSRQVFLDANSAFVIECERLPCAHRRKPEFVFPVMERPQEASAEPPRLLEIPRHMWVSSSSLNRAKPPTHLHRSRGTRCRREFRTCPSSTRPKLHDLLPPWVVRLQPPAYQSA